MKKRFLVFFVFFLLIGNLYLPNIQVHASTQYLDVPNNYWAKKEIEYLANTGIIKGYKNGNFGINEKVTRSQAATMIVRALKLDMRNRPNPGFQDVPKNYPAYKEIATAVDEGIFSKSRKFYPNKSLTRAEMAKVLVNAFHLKFEQDVNYKDVNPSNWSAKFISILSTNGIAIGYTDLTFKGSQPITRSHFAVFLARVLNENFRPKIIIFPKRIAPDVYYPIVKGIGSTAEEKINNALYQKGLQGKQAYQEVQKSKQDYSDDPFSKYYTYNMTYEVMRSDSQFISIKFNDYSYMGGAHGLYDYTSYNFETSSGKQYHTLKEYFGNSSDYVSVINNEIRKKIYQRQLTDPYYFENFDSIDPETDRFYLTNKGVGVYFSLYEYTSFAEGIPEFVIPYSYFE
ncbi:S-layer homology domain-containing protein [Bacillus sp. FSL W8-1127]|uniref:S-layer homology domain-containing protein n=1 Tax=unclassified Bacillus (in: firmicutes) TaxID=185979 RepID=UPI0030F81FE5